MIISSARVGAPLTLAVLGLFSYACERLTPAESKHVNVPSRVFSTLDAPQPVFRFGSYGFRHAGAALGGVLSPDGAVWLTGGEDGKVRIWDWQKRQAQGVLSASGDSVGAVALSPDGKIVAAGSFDRTISLWNLVSKKKLRVLKGHEDLVNTLAFSNDGKLLYSGSSDRTLRVWRVEDGKLLRTSNPEIHDVVSLAVAADDKQLAVATKNILKLVDAKTGKETKVFKGHSGRIFSVIYSNNGNQLISCSQDETVRLWDIQSGKQILSIKPNEAWVYVAAMSPDNQVLAVGTHPSITLWNAKDGSALRKLSGHKNRVTALAFSKDGKFLLSASADSTVKIWDLSKGEEIDTRAGHHDKVTSLALSPDEQFVVSGSEDNTVRLWKQNGEEQILKEHSSAISSVRYLPDGKHLLSSSLDATLRLWDLAEGSSMELTSHLRAISGAELSSGGRWVAWTSEDNGRVNLWDLDKKREIWSRDGHTSPATSVAISPDDRYVVSGATGTYGADEVNSDVGKTLIVWDRDKGTELRSLDGHKKGIGSLAYSPDGAWILSGGRDDAALKLWNTSTWTTQADLTGHTDKISAVGFSCDGKFAISAALDGWVYFWDVDKKSIAQRINLGDDGDYATSLRNSSDCKTLYVGTYFGVINRYELTGKP